MFWRPDCYRFVIPAKAILQKEKKIEKALRIPSPHYDSTILTLQNGEEHLLLRRDKCALQLVCPEGGLQEGRLSFSHFVAGPDQLTRQIVPLRQLESLYRLGRLPRTLFPLAAHAQRLRLVLQALDGRLAGASYREIALTIFNEKRVREDWDGTGCNLFAQTRRTVQRGLYLMREGYRQFLK